MNKPGRYDNLSNFIRMITAADGVILIVLDGQLGAGFSCTAIPEITNGLPQILREVANQIELERKENNAPT